MTQECHQWPRGTQESPGAHGPSAAARGARRRPHACWPPPLPARGSALRLGAKRSLASRAGPAAAMHSSPVASPSAGLVKVTRAVRLPPNPPSQDGPAGPGRPSLPPVLAWPRSGSHTRHFPPSVGDAAGMSERSCGRRRRSGSGTQIPAGRGGWRSPGKRASAPPTAGARRRPPPLRTGSRAVRGGGRAHFNRTPGAGRIRWIPTRSG